MSLTKYVEEFLGKAPAHIEPQHYKVGVSSGDPAIAKSVGVTAVTVTKLVSGAIFKGGEVIQVDVDFPTTITPHDKAELQNIARVHNLTLAMHASVAYPFDIDSPERKDYILVEKELPEYIKVAAEIGMKFIVIHNSYNISPTYEKDVVDYYMGTPVILFVDPDGKPFVGRFRGKALDWYVNHTIQRRPGRANDVINNVLHQKFKSNERINEYLSKLSEAEYEALRVSILKENIKSLLTSGISKYDVFRIVAWNMYEEKDYLWQTLAEGKRPDVLEAEGREMKLANAVVAKYVQGHIKKVKRTLEEKGVMLILETPDLRNPEARGLFTLVRPTDAYYLVKGMNSRNVRMAIDFEHLASHGYNLVQEIASTPGDIGKYVGVMHLGSYPSPAHSHIPIEKGDTFLYGLLWMLRKKGMKEAYLIFERGGGRDEEVWKQSTDNLKQMAMYLEKDISPKRLPPEFHGYSRDEFEHDRRIMEEHTFDPLQGLLESPQLQHTWLGREAITKKGLRPEEWAKEEYR